jgi:hypothetical protein
MRQGSFIGLLLIDKDAYHCLVGRARRISIDLDGLINDLSVKHEFLSI